MHNKNRPAQAWSAAVAALLTGVTYAQDGKITVDLRSAGSRSNDPQAFTQALQDFSQHTDPASMAAYGRSVQLHIASDPIKAAKYATMTIMVNEGAKQYGGYDKIPRQYFETVVSTTDRIEKRMLDDAAAAKGDYQFDAAIKSTAKALGGVGGGIVGGKLGGPKGATAGVALGAGVAEKTINGLEELVAQSKQVDAQYAYADSLNKPSLDLEAEKFKRDCVTDDCMKTADAIFGRDMENTSIFLSADDRIKKDHALAADKQTAETAEINKKILDRLNKLQPGATKGQIKEIVSDVMDGLSDVVRETVFEAIKEGKSDAGAAKEPPISQEKIQNTQALFSLGQSFSVLFHDDTTAAAFQQMGPAIVDLQNAINAKSAGKLTELGMAATTMNAVVVGVQVMSMLNKRNGPSADEQMMKMLVSISNQIHDLHTTVVKGFTSVNANILLSTNSLSNSMDRLQVKMDWAVEQMFSLRRDFQRDVRANFYEKDEVRSTDFAGLSRTCLEDYNKGANGQLSAEMYSKCTIDFMSAAVEGARYTKRQSNFIEEPSLLDGNPVRFPFANHLPLILQNAGVASASGLVHPEDWARNSMAYMSLVAGNPDARMSATRIVDDLDELQSAGRNLRTQVMAIGFENSTGQQRLSTGLFERMLDDYRAKLITMSESVRMSDTGTASGKKLLEDAEQDIPADKLAIIDTILSGQESGTRRSIGACADSDEANFVMKDIASLVGDAGVFRKDADGHHLENREVAFAEMNRAWNKQAVQGMRLPDDYLRMIPRPYLWGDLGHLGKVEFCFSRYQPTAVHFKVGRRSGQRDHYRPASLDADIQLQLRFTPEEKLQSAFGLAKGTRKYVTLKTYPYSAHLGSIGYAFKYYDPPNHTDVYRAPFALAAAAVWDANQQNCQGDCEIDGGKMPLAKYIHSAPATNDKDYGKNLEIIKKLSNDQGAREVYDYVAKFAQTDAYRDAVNSYLTLFATASVSLSQVQNAKFALETIFGESSPHLTSPQEALDLIAKSKVNVPAYTKKVDQLIAAAKKSFATIGNYLAAPDTAPSERIPVIVGRIDDVLTRLSIIETGVEERAKLSTARTPKGASPTR